MSVKNIGKRLSHVHKLYRGSQHKLGEHSQGDWKTYGFRDKPTAKIYTRRTEI